MRPIETSTSDFADLRRNGTIYVDKTAWFHRLASDVGRKICFLSRPRRFGKSLMITALKEIFSGNRELFDGLAISKTDWKWEKWPVIHFNFGDADSTSVEAFDRDFGPNVRRRLESAGFEGYDDARSPGFNFGNAIDVLSKENGGHGVVILIDEYDAPVSHALSDLPRAETIRDRLSAFYSVMKDRTGSIRFMMMTGVSKFTKMSVFSCLNNIVDVSMDEEFATMLGYTEKELESNFDEHLRVHAEKMGKSYEDYRAEMKRWYNGFRFSRFGCETVYNPISVALTLYKKEPVFSATWSSTGRASSLMNCLKRWDMLAIDPERTKNVTDQEFDVTNLADLKPIGMLFQTGYLTIKDYADEFYTLGVPDEEVRRDLNLLLAGVAADESVAWASSLGAKLRGCDWNSFFAGLKSLYAKMAYGSTEASVHENSYARCLSFLLAGSGFRFTMEDVQASGRARHSLRSALSLPQGSRRPTSGGYDIVASHVNGVFIFELKVGEPVDRAFAQIRRKNYAEPYLASGSPIWLIGLSFDPDSRLLVEAAAEPYFTPQKEDKQ